MQRVIVTGGILISVAVTSFFLGLTYDSYSTSPAHQIREIGTYKYVNPLLECDLAEGTISAPKINFSGTLKKEAERIKKEFDLTGLSFYYRDLNNGPTFGVNYDLAFIPASLLKLPVAMAFYKYNEDTPGVLETKIVYSKVFNEGSATNKQLIPPREAIELGKKYTVNELIYRSLVFSDNQAISLLYEHIPPQYLRLLYERLGVDEAVLNGPGGTLTVKNYSTFFRTLFNASYLTRDDSEKILAILTQIEFKDGLRASIPNEVQIAHKFGEAGYLDGDKQLHDCGIVYYPKHPYLLCVMTKGSSLENLKLAIQGISKKTFEEVDKQYDLLQ